MSFSRPYIRFLKPVMWSVASSSLTATTAGRCFCVLFEVPHTLKVDAITFINGATVAGNVRVGIYGPCASETMLDAVLAVESASTAQSGTNAPQTITFTETTLKKGRYYACLQFDDTTATAMRQANQSQLTGLNQTYDRGGGYGAFTTPAPAMTNTGSNAPALLIRVSG